MQLWTSSRLPGSIRTCCEPSQVRIGPLIDNVHECSTKGLMQLIRSRFVYGRSEHNVIWNIRNIVRLKAFVVH